MSDKKRVQVILTLDGETKGFRVGEGSTYKIATMRAIKDLSDRFIHGGFHDAQFQASRMFN